MTLDYTGRDGWGARHPDGFTDRPMPYTGFVLHHTAGSWVAPDDGVDREHELMLGLESVGQNRFRGGISYPWIVFASGNVYQGLSPHRRGAHTRGLNSSHSAVAFPGNLDNQEVTDAQVEACARMMVAEKDAGHAKQARILLGHRQAPDARTVCPGRNGMAAIARINARAAAIEAGDPAPEPKPDPKPEPRPDPEPARSWTENIVRNLPTLTLQSPMRRGTDVARLQGLLIASGHAPANTIRGDRVDGIFGPGTRGAVVAFQRSARIGVDGIVGRQTWTALLGG